MQWTIALIQLYYLAKTCYASSLMFTKIKQALIQTSRVEPLSITFSLHFQLNDVHFINHDVSIHQQHKDQGQIGYVWFYMILNGCL